MTELANRPATSMTPAVPGVRRSSLLGVERRPADSRDASFLRDLFAEARDDLWLLPSDTRDVIVDMQYRALRRARQVGHPGARHEVLLVGGVRAGQVLVAVDHATVQIVDLTVRAGLRGLGIGTDVLAELTADADRTRRVMQARVWTGNHGARQVFLRAGFRRSAALGGYDELYRPPA